MSSTDSEDSRSQSVPFRTPVEAFKAVPHLAVHRASPRPCVNQALVDELSPLRTERFQNYGSGAKESISYATAISTIIGCPYKIETLDQALALHKIGEKIGPRVEEFLKTGKIEESRQAVQKKEFIAVKELTTVHGIGWNRANELYANGITNLAQLKAAGLWPSNYNPAYHDDIQQKIPREEVENIAEFIKIQLDRVEPGAHTVLCGGYRRGKQLSNDIDLIITYPHQEGKERGVLKKLLRRLQQKGLIPEDGLLSVQYSGSDRTSKAARSSDQFDCLDKALVVFKHPANDTTRPRDHWRRVDLIFANWQAFGSAVVGWTGSTQFERDIRRHAHAKNMKFDSGALRIRDTGAVIPTPHERDVFRKLDLEYIPDP